MDALCHHFKQTAISTTAQTASSHPPKQRLGFLDLSGEIRNQIYAYMFIDPDRRGFASNRKKLQAQFLRTSRQIYHEASSILYAENSFTIDVQPNMIRFPHSPRLCRDPKLALSRDWNISISVLEPGENEDDHAGAIPANIPKVKRNLRAICLLLAAQPGPQSRIVITLMQNMSLHPALWQRHTGILEPLTDVRARIVDSRYAVYLGSELEIVRAEYIAEYMTEIEETVRQAPDHRSNNSTLCRKLYGETVAYARVFFAAHSPWIQSITWTMTDDLNDLPQALDLSELLAQRRPDTEPYDEWVWEETLRTGYVDELRDRLSVALNVLEDRFVIIQEQRQIMSYTPMPPVEDLPALVEWIGSLDPDKYDRAGLLDKLFGLFPYIKSFEEPMDSQSIKGMENYYTEWEDRRLMSYEERAADFLPASLLHRLRILYEDVLEGIIPVEEMVEVVVAAKEWCETQFAEMTAARELFYMRPLFRQWMGERAPNMDWKDEVL